MPAYQNKGKKTNPLGSLKMPPIHINIGGGPSNQQQQPQNVQPGSANPSSQVNPGVMPGPSGPMTLEQWLNTDADYQNQLRMYASQLNNYSADATRQRGQAEGDYSSQLQRMNVQHGRDTTNLQNNFGGRGLIHSGMYGQAYGQQEQDSNMNFADLIRNKTNVLGNIDSAQQNYQQQLQQQQEQARIESVRRRLLTAGRFQ